MQSDALVKENQDAIWAELGVPVLIDGAGPYPAIKEEQANDFDQMTGTTYRLAFKGHEAIHVQTGSVITFEETGTMVSALSAPLRIERKQVVSYEPDRQGVDSGN